MRIFLISATCLLLGLSCFAAAQDRSFDFYLLSLSYAPDFCHQPGGNKPASECGVGRKLSFVVHGLWPQSNAGRGPENCGGSPVKQSLIQTMLAYIPGASLIQHEWTTHGTCSGLSQADYFAQIRKAKDNVKIPAAFAAAPAPLTITAAELENQFATANPSYPKDAFRTSCYNNGELQEVRICLRKDLTAQACPASVQDCRSSKIKLMPVK